MNDETSLSTRSYKVEIVLAGLAVDLWTLGLWRPGGPYDPIWGLTPLFVFGVLAVFYLWLGVALSTRVSAGESILGIAVVGALVGLIHYLLYHLIVLNAPPPSVDDVVVSMALNLSMVTAFLFFFVVGHVIGTNRASRQR